MLSVMKSGETLYVNAARGTNTHASAAKWLTDNNVTNSQNGIAYQLTKNTNTAFPSILLVVTSAGSTSMGTYTDGMYYAFVTANRVTAPLIKRV